MFTFWLNLNSVITDPKLCHLSFPWVWCGEEYLQAEDNPPMRLFLPPIPPIGVGAAVAADAVVGMETGTLI